MTDRPIIFSGPMVRALLDGRKSQTRRLLNPQPTGIARAEPISGTLKSWTLWPEGDRCSVSFKAPPYAPEDRLYVREAHSLHRAHGQDFAKPSDDHGRRWGPWSGLPIAVSPDKTQVAYYREGFDRSGPPKWRPSIHMPRWASRITLTVTEVMVQRLQEISEADAVAEGVHAVRTLSEGSTEFSAPSHIESFRGLWNSLHGPDAWTANPWVVAVTFAVRHGNIDQETTP